MGGFGSTTRSIDGLPLAAAHELDDLDFRTRIDRRGGPEFSFDNSTVQLNGHSFGREAEGFNDARKRCSGGEIAPLAVNCHVIFNRHRDPWIIIVGWGNPRS